VRAQLLWFTLLFFRILAVCVYSVRGTGGWPMPGLCKKWQYALCLAQIICKSLFYKEKVSVSKCLIVTWYLESLAGTAQNKNKTRWLWLCIFYLYPLNQYRLHPLSSRVDASNIFTHSQHISRSPESLHISIASIVSLHCAQYMLANGTLKLLICND